VPLLDKGLKDLLLKNFEQKAPVKKMLFSYWRKIAAAFFIIAISSAGYWIWKKNNNGGTNHSITKTPARATPQPTVPHTNELPKTTPSMQAIIPQNLLAVRPNKQPIRQTPVSKIKKPVPANKPIASYAVSVNTLVQSDTLLLAYITEVY
jgi:hypothetical protein